VTFPLW